LEGEEAVAAPITLLDYLAAREAGAQAAGEVITTALRELPTLAEEVAEERFYLTVETEALDVW
jgi:hypothetical protein